MIDCLLYSMNFDLFYFHDYNDLLKIIYKYFLIYIYQLIFYIIIDIIYY